MERNNVTSHLTGRPMFSSPKTLQCKAGEWNTIIQTRFAQLPVMWTVRTLDDLLTLGEFEETKSSWIFPGAPRIGPLLSEMQFQRGYWNTFYKVRIRPEHAITISLQQSWL